MTKKNNKIGFWFCFSLFFTSVVLLPSSTVQAIEEGGQVGNGAEIEFYTEDSTAGSSSDVEKKPSVAVGNSPAKTIQPARTGVGKLPQTGEKKPVSQMINGLFFVIVTVFFWFSTKKKGQRRESE